VKRWFPQPLVSLTLFLVWLALNNTIHPAHLLLGAVLAVAIPLWTARVPHSVGRPRAWLTAAILGAVVFYDIVKSNIDVARLILGSESRIQPGFVWVPLDVQNPYGRVALAGIITMTPGTLSADFAEDGRHLLVHAFNVADANALAADIKARYEVPLMEVFGE
jgi:multicomponent K+:H+ antiporter subunit E